MPDPEGGENPKAAASTLPPPQHALLDETTTEISIDQAAFGASYRFAEFIVLYALSPREARELPCCKDLRTRSVPPRG